MRPRLQARLVSFTLLSIIAVVGCLLFKETQLTILLLGSQSRISTVRSNSLQYTIKYGRDSIPFIFKLIRAQESEELKDLIIKQIQEVDEFYFVRPSWSSDYFAQLSDNTPTVNSLIFESAEFTWAIEYDFLHFFQSNHIYKGLDRLQAVKISKLDFEQMVRTAEGLSNLTLKKQALIMIYCIQANSIEDSCPAILLEHCNSSDDLIRNNAQMCFLGLSYQVQGRWLSISKPVLNDSEVKYSEFRYDEVDEWLYVYRTETEKWLSKEIAEVILEKILDRQNQRLLYRDHELCLSQAVFVFGPLALRIILKKFSNDLNQLEDLSYKLSVASKLHQICLRDKLCSEYKPQLSELIELYSQFSSRVNELNLKSPQKNDSPK